MADAQQLRLLLWKDYLIRKRKVITLAGVVWATAVVFSLYIVRINVDNQDFPTCQFPARALPSAGMLTFLQSFMCSVNNECTPFEEFDEIPTYENSKLTQIQRKLTPILNDTVLDVASTVPDAVKLLATLADVVDVPAFVEISKNGLKVQDLFKNPNSAKLLIADKLGFNDDVAQSVFDAELSVTGILKGDLDKCSRSSISKTLVIKNVEHLNVLVDKLCSTSDEDLQKMLIDLLLEVNYSKYIAMLGQMYYKLAKDDRLIVLGDMLTAVLRMTKLDSFLPPELISIFQKRDTEFSYIALDLLPKFLDQFEPTFKDTMSYQSIRGIADAVVVALQYMDKIISKGRTSDRDNLNQAVSEGGLQGVSNVLHNAVQVFEEAVQKDSSVDTFNVLAQIMNFMYKFLPEDVKNDVIFYSTLLAKLMESAQKIIEINMRIEELTYNVTLRHPKAIQTLQTLPPMIVSKTFDALTDAGRTQILTSKINHPTQMMCDLYRLQTFFVISKKDAESLKKKICNDVWKEYISDLIRSFGVYEAKKNINGMTSLLIQSTLGKDTSDQMYTIDQDFKILKNFTRALIKLDAEARPNPNWNSLLNVSDDSGFIKVLREKGHLGKQMLIVIHGALAKEIVQQNPILDFKISPYLVDVTNLVSAFNKQLHLTPESVTSKLKSVYPDIVKSILKTALNDEKTYRALSTPSRDIFCNGVDDVDEYLEISGDSNTEDLVSAMCDATVAIENGLLKDSYVSIAIKEISTSAHAVTTVDWTKLINNLKDLYIKLEQEYPYLFEFYHYGMDKNMQKDLEVLINEAKEYWFGLKNMERSLHLCVKLLFKLLDILDTGLFDINDHIWLKMKFALQSSVGPFTVFDDSIKLIKALITGEEVTSDLPPTTVAAPTSIVPNIPQLTMDAVDILLNDSIEVDPIIGLLNAEPPWPCSRGSLTDLLPLTNSSKEAMEGLETLFCLDRELQEEWVEYLAAKNASIDKSLTWNSTVFEPHIFLKFSGTFDGLVEDVIAIKDVLSYIGEDKTTADHVGFASAWKYAVDSLNTTKRNEIMGNVFRKTDIILNSVDTSSPMNVSVSKLWEQFFACSKDYIEDDCKVLSRAAWKYSLYTMSVMLENIATDLMTYFTEIHEPNSNVLQILGFTKKTGLYILYDKMADFITVLLNSYWDFGFMSQVRRASLSQFWDCEAIVTALVPPPGSIIDEETIKKVQPFVCPSLLHWISLPRGDNTLLDVFAKPQYFFYVLEVDNLTSNFESAFTKATSLADYLTTVAEKNETLVNKEDLTIHSIKKKLDKFAEDLTSYRIKETDVSYRKFAEIIKNQITLNIYVTRIVTMINKVYEGLNNLSINEIADPEIDDIKKLEDELVVVRNMFKRRPLDAVRLHFDVLTDAVWMSNRDGNYSLVNALQNMCEEVKSNSSRHLLEDPSDLRSKRQICAKNFELIYGAVQSNLQDDLEYAKMSLENVVKALTNDSREDLRDVFEVFARNPQVISAIQTSVKNVYDLSLPIYVKYLQSNIQSYNIILKFLSGDDWWKELKAVYNGPYAQKFFGYVEQSFEVAENVLTNLDEIHLVRLMHDVEVNQTDLFCLPNITLSDYFPDKTGMLSEMKRQLCVSEKTELFRELPPLLFASQGYDSALKLPRTVDYSALYQEIETTTSLLDPLSNGPSIPQLPPWVTDEKLRSFRTVLSNLLSKECMTKVSFGILANGVDAGTLFLNSSQCLLCSEFTAWFKQLNLQLYKKQEYDSLMCHLHSMSLEDIYSSLKDNFHWDMVLQELISIRNYTKYEMNKSMNEFLVLVKVNLLEDMATDSKKLSNCLARNITRNQIGNATLVASVLANTAKLFRAELPHIHEVEGIKEIRYLKELAKEVAHNIDVRRPLEEYLRKGNDLSEKLMMISNSEVAENILESEVNLRKLRQSNNVDLYITLPSSSWQEICSSYNCSAISAVIFENTNMTQFLETLPVLQLEEFWRFNFVSNIIHHIEDMISHGARLLGVASKVDMPGVLEGRLESLLDTMMMLMTEDSVDSVLYSLHGLIGDMHPVLANTTLEHDLEAIASGLKILFDMKNYLLDNMDLQLEVSKLFPDTDAVESSLSALGINNTNFWSIAAPRIWSGHVQLKPLLSTKQDSRISSFVCQMDSMAKVILPSNLDVVSAEDVYAAVVDQFCGLSDERVKLILPVLLRNFNFTVVTDKVVTILLSKLYTASNLTEEEGETVMSKYQEMAALVPVIQGNVGDVAKMFKDEPLFQSLQGFSSVDSLLSSSDFMVSAGQMMCGKPFHINLNRMYKTIAAAQDFTTEPDQAQLDVLPTDFCRSLYQDIVKVEGGKIVWSFVKPLIMGKILYTPASPAVTRIIEKANSSFATMIKMTNLVHSFAQSFPAVLKLTSHRDGINVLRRIMTSPQFSDLRATITGDVGSSSDGSEVPVPDIDVDELLDQFGDLNNIGNLLTKVSELLRCINLNRFRPASNEEQLTHDAAELSIVNEFSAGLVFLNATESLSNVEYKIRMDVDNAPTTVRLKDYLWIPGPEASFIENMRYFRGFIQIQDLVDKAIIELSRPSRPKREVAEEDKWAVYTQQEPYPCYRKDFFQTTVYESQVLLVCFFFALLFSVASTVRFIVADKESGNTMLMSVMGVNLRWHTLSWAISSFLELTVTSALITIVLHAGHILPKTDATLIFTLLFMFSMAVLSFCYLLSKLFHSASMGAVCGAILYLMSFMPFIIILSLEAILENSLKLVVSISMSSSLCYAFLYVARYEAHGTGAQWSHLWDSPNEAEDMSIGIAAIMMIVDAALYLAIGCLIDKYFGFKTLTTNITHCTTTDEKAGVSIVNVTKIYKEGSRNPKVALDNVSIELHKGQITTLLGHNGAGKTTLIKILTGMMKPTKGHIIVRSERATGTRLGVCPQRDVLFEYMTAKEHIMLYAQLKTGLSAREVQDEVDKMLNVLNLGPVCLEPVTRLSGGTRRRLCVALAFIGQPHLVSLDEPTAGVDPTARRDIWSMIVKLKEDRTILLTTHHLDEAELLSDQIVIMHKGQVHTTGSPIEIKRTLGNGYKLTVIYPEKDILENGTEEYNLESWQEDISLEEKTKQLLAIVRDVVKNANLVDIDGLEVEIALPFFDANGLNNNFLQLCSVLEATQTALGFRSYSLDCSSLEQVFFNICQQADAPQNGIEYVSEDFSSKSASTSTIRTDRTAKELVPSSGPLRGTMVQQFLALMHARYLHHIRNRWLLFMLIGLPTIFVAVAMGFSMLRPPADNEISLRLDRNLYGGSTEYIVPEPSIYSPIDSSFAEEVMRHLEMGKLTRDWSEQENPSCKCLVTHMECDIQTNQTMNLPQLEMLPDTQTLNEWLVDTHDIYIEKRYGGFSSVLKNNITNLIAWYNNKGHHAMPAYLNALNNAILRTVVGDGRRNITTYTHPLKISKEQISKSTVYQHIADAGISALVLVAYCLVSAGSAVYLVGARRSQEKRLQLLSGVSPLLYWATALVWDIMIMAINMGITAIIMLAFGFPVFVAKNNLPAICLLIILYGYACVSLVHLAEKLFTDASMANMILFCGNSFIGLSCIALLLILDIISESEATDNARNVLHKIFLLAPQFALGDGLLEIAKNTIQALVLNRFGMDTYKDPLDSSLILYHYISLAVVGTVLFLLNLAIEYDYFEVIVSKFRSEQIPARLSGELEPLEVSEERRRVRAVRLHPQPLRVNTIGNINRGFVLTECKKNSIERVVSPAGDAAQCVDLGKVYPGFASRRVALRSLTLGIPPGQCTALLGENGAGKSTTFAMLTGEVRPSDGQIYLNNKIVNSRQLCKGLISYCPQSDALDSLLTVRETLVFYCRLRGIDNQDEVIKRTLEMFDLTKYADVQSGTLSGGNKRKLCTAIAFMARTPLVLLDEPTSGMDPVSRGCVSRGVRMARAARRGVLLSTHALADARRLAARVALLRAGELKALAGLDQCLTRFGGGHVVQCRVGRSGSKCLWRRIRQSAPHASLQVLHKHTLHFLLPSRATVNQKEITTRLSDIFRLMAELQSSCEIEDYTVNQSSLEQMFLSFSDKPVDDQVDLEPLPSPETIRKGDELDSITSL